MLKRTTTLTIVSFLLLTSVNGRMGNTPFTTKNPASHKEQVREKVQRAIEDARKNATYDSSGRMLATTIELPRLGKFKFEYRYDRKNRLQYIVDENGGLTHYEYRKNGEVQTITLPDDTRMYELDENGKGIFFKHGIDHNDRGGLRFNKLAMAQGGDACKAAVAAAAVAAAAAAVSCSTGDVAGCILNTAQAVAAAYAAYVACKENAFEIEEGPVT